MAVAAVSGASGMLGTAVVRALKGAGYEAGPLPRYSKQLEPGTDLVVHCAARTGAADCERHYSKAVADNAVWPGVLAMAARPARFIHVSTVAVYDILRSGPHTETEKLVLPRDAYAASKVEGEQRVLDAHPDATVIRPWIFGRVASGSRPKLADKILARLRKAKQMALWSNQWFNPLCVDDLADIIVQLIGVDAPGPLNVGSTDPVSQYEFGRMLAREFGLDDVLCLARERPQTEDLTVDVRRLKKLVGRSPPSVAQTLAQFRSAR